MIPNVNDTPVEHSAVLIKGKEGEEKTGKEGRKKKEWERKKMKQEREERRRNKNIKKIGWYSATLCWFELHPG